MDTKGDDMDKQLWRDLLSLLIVLVLLAIAKPHLESIRDRIYLSFMQGFEECAEGVRPFASASDVWFATQALEELPEPE